MLEAVPRETRARRAGPSVALVLLASVVLPLLVIGYLVYGIILPSIEVRQTNWRVAVQALALLGAAGLAVGGWAMVRAVRGPGARAQAATPLAESTEGLRRTIEQQTAAIAAYQARLEEAHKDLETTNARLQETSFKDDLTGLYNRRFFFVRLEEEISRHRRFNHPVAVVLFDLDGFKDVNDEQGHIIGDETLRDIGQILMKHSRGINVVSRYGGDEFAILLVETSKAGARLYADRIRQIISNYPYSHGMRVTASFGVASLPEDEALTSEDLVRIADEQLYVAKRAGKNQVAGTRPPNRVG